MPPIDSSPAPKISVVVPVHNGAAFLGPCLESVFASDFPCFEVIVVDDASTDSTASIAAHFPVKVILSPRRGGPAAARNTGAESARGEILFFLDADILIQPGTLRAIAADFAAHPAVSALFGSYGTHTIPANFFSRYKNLVHHFTHQNSSEEASTFCSGFGAIRREAFEQLQGFDPGFRYLEDIELGYRMTQAGIRIRLRKDLQFTHCKRYSFFSLLRSDVAGRAIPWTRLMLARGIFRNDLNTRWNNVLSVPVAFLVLLCPVLPHGAYAAAALTILFLALNAKFLSLTYREGGPPFALSSALMCWFSYLYSGLGVAAGAIWHCFSRTRALLRPATRVIDA
jgi:glycosyltransferase involved in cell wall biosynthesis